MPHAFLMSRQVHSQASCGTIHSSVSLDHMLSTRSTTSHLTTFVLSILSLLTLFTLYFKLRFELFLAALGFANATELVARQPQTTSAASDYSNWHP
jgi:hypothetical protein